MGAVGVSTVRYPCWLGTRLLCQEPIRLLILSGTVEYAAEGGQHDAKSSHGSRHCLVVAATMQDVAFGVTFHVSSRKETKSISPDHQLNWTWPPT